MEGTVYKCTDGCYYGDADVWAQFESGAWTPCCWDEETGKEWVETRQDQLLVLTPTSRHTVSEGTQIEHVADGLSVSAGQPIDDNCCC